jgi:putative ABC transport system permease protein
VRRARLRVGRGSLSRVLIGVQFAISGVLVIAVNVAYLQNAHLRETGLGADSLPLLVIQNDPSITKVAPELLREELEGLPQVSAAGLMGSSPWTIHPILTIAKSPEESAIEKPIYRYIVGRGFFDALNMRVLAGRAFETNFTDSPRRGQALNIVADQAFIDEFELGSPDQAVGQVVYVPYRYASGFGWSAAVPMKIVGVVQTQPLAMFGNGPRSTIYTYGSTLPVQVIRLSTRDLGSALASIDALWSRIAPSGVSIERRFVDDLFNEQYENFARINQVFTVLTALAMLVSIIGLCAIALLVANARIHEIGVRKTAGATTWQIVLLLISGFASPVLIANVVSWPFGFALAKTYLKPFIYPIALTPLPFATSLGFSLATCLGVVFAQSWRAATMKPSDILRAE